MLRRTLLTGMALGFVAACQRSITIARDPELPLGVGDQGSCTSDEPGCGTVAADTVPLEDSTSVGPASSGLVAVSRVLAGLKLAIDVGHSGSGSDLGAFGKGISEYDLNVAEANALARILRARGATVSVFHYPQTTELDERGRNAAGHQIFVSIHHNAFGDPSVQGTEVLVGTQNQSAADQSLAKAINARIVQELWGSQPGERDRGAKAQSLGVLRNAPASVYAKCLTEAFFITGGSMTPSMARTFVDRSARAMAGALETFWLSSRTKMTALGAPVAADPGFEPWPEAQDELGIYSDH